VKPNCKGGMFSSRSAVAGLFIVKLATSYEQENRVKKMKTNKTIEVRHTTSSHVRKRLVASKKEKEVESRISSTNNSTANRIL
jgi:hypothetical protein